MEIIIVKKGYDDFILEKPDENLINYRFILIDLMKLLIPPILLEIISKSFTLKKKFKTNQIKK